MPAPHDLPRRGGRRAGPSSSPTLRPQAPGGSSADGARTRSAYRSGLHFSPPSGAPDHGRDLPGQHRGACPCARLGSGDRGYAAPTSSASPPTARAARPRVAGSSRLATSSGSRSLAGRRLPRPPGAAVLPAPLPEGRRSYTFRRARAAAERGPLYVASQAPGRTVLLRDPGCTGPRLDVPRRVVLDAGLPARGDRRARRGRLPSYMPLTTSTPRARSRRAATGTAASGPAAPRRRPGSSASSRAPPRRRPAHLQPRRRPFRDIALDAPSTSRSTARDRGRRRTADDGLVPPAMLASRTGSAYPVDGPDLERRAGRGSAPPGRAGRSTSTSRPAGERPRRQPSCGTARPHRSRVVHCPGSTARSAATAHRSARS